MEEAFLADSECMQMFGEIISFFYEKMQQKAFQELRGVDILPVVFSSGEKRFEAFGRLIMTKAFNLYGDYTKENMPADGLVSCHV